MGLWIVSKKKFDVVKLRFLLQNTLSKKIIASACELEPDGKTRFEHFLDNYIANKKFSLMKRVKVFPFKKVLDIIRKAFDESPEEFKHSLNNLTIRKIFLNAFRSLNCYGLATPQNFYSPIMVVWNFTYRCNLRCKHCYQDAGMLRRGSPDELTYEEKLAALDKLAKEGIPTLSFSGGEPLTSPDFFKVAEAAKRKGFYISIATNGTLWTKEAAQKAKEIGFGYVGVSLDAADPAIHDNFRGVPGMWKKAVQGIKNLMEAGITTCVQYTLSKDNIKELPKMLELVKKLGALKLIVYNYIPVGRGGFENDPTPEEREQAYKLMYDELDQGYHIIATTAPQFGRFCREVGSKSVIMAHYYEGKAKELGAIADIIGGCGAGRAYCALQPDGRVTPCVYMPDVTIGNLKNQSFREIWDDPKMAQFRTRDNLQENCKDCEHKHLCGGCRARAYAYTGSFKGPDPGCIKNKDFYYNHLEIKKLGRMPQEVKQIQVSSQAK